MELQDVGQVQKADTSMDNENKQPQMPVEDKSRGYFSDGGTACVKPWRQDTAWDAHVWDFVWLGLCVTERTGRKRRPGGP